MTAVTLSKEAGAKRRHEPPSQRSINDLSTACTSWSGQSGGGDRRGSFWTRLVKSGLAGESDNGWDNDSASYDGGKEGVAKNAEPCRRCGRTLAEAVRRFASAIHRNPSVLLFSLLVFSSLSASGLFAVHRLAVSYTEEQKHVVATSSKEALEYFSDEFGKAMMPLFTLSQLVKHDERLRTLADRIGDRGSPGARPGLPGKETEYRDVRGICDDPDLLKYFADVAEGVKRDSGMGRALSNLRLAPMGVMCVIHPLINTVDYDPPGYYNGTKHLYKDWNTHSPRLTASLKETLEAQHLKGEEKITLSGPYKLKSAGADKSVISENLFCTHLGVDIPGYNITVEGTNYPSWGFVMGFMNWALLVEGSGMHRHFQEMGMVFHLQRKALKINQTTGEHYTDTDTIAISHDGCPFVNLTESDRLSVPMEVNHEHWELYAGLTCGFQPSWKSAADVSVIIASFVGSFLLLLLLVEKRRHRELLYKMMPARAVKRLERGQTVAETYNVVTIFFSDIVGFTTMAGEMRPMEVMRMLNALYLEFDKLTERHGVYKVETIGDAYMVLGGAPERTTGPEGAKRVALFALDAIRCVRDFTFDGNQIHVRAGIASGPTVAGVIGDAMPRYCLFGDTVNFASRMESTSKKMRIQCEDLTYRLLRDCEGAIFDFEERKEAETGKKGIDIKGKGWTHTWWINGAETWNTVSRSTRDGKAKTGRRALRWMLPGPTQSTNGGDDVIPHNIHTPGIITEEIVNDVAKVERRNSMNSVLTENFVIDNPTSEGKKQKKTSMGLLQKMILSRSCDQEEHTIHRGKANSDNTPLSTEAANSLSLSLRRQHSWQSILHHANAQANTTTIAKALTSQHWTCLGQGKDPLTAATGDKTIMISRMVSLLEHRLEALCASRAERCASILPPVVRFQLQQFVTEIESLYNDVHYHSFEHASHVTVSANKLIDLCTENNDGVEALKTCPLTHFALVFAALVHDVEHKGVSNRMLIDLDKEMAAKYDNRSIAEQNSIDIALHILFKPCFCDLRDVIFPTIECRVTFGQVLRGTILCTDIASKEQMGACVRRWEHLMSGNAVNEECNCFEDSENSHSHEHLGALGLPEDDRQFGCCPFPSQGIQEGGGRLCLHGCVVLEHMIQVADVAHTMQGWGNFVKWNYRLFRELYACHKSGLMPDPAPGWADGQVSFFDGYIIPLAKRLEGTGALGTHGARLVRRAEENRARWSEAGTDIAVMMANGMATGQDEDRTLQLILLRAFKDGEKCLLWDDSSDTSISGASGLEEE